MSGTILDAGETWQSFGQEFDERAINALAFSPSDRKLYVATPDAGLFEYSFFANGGPLPIPAMQPGGALALILMLILMAYAVGRRQHR